MRAYTLEVLERAYRREYGDLPEEEIREKARELYKKLQALDVYRRYGNRKAYEMSELI